MKKLLRDLITQLGYVLSTNGGRVWYVYCWTEDDGIYFCGHKHESIAESMKCLVPDGGGFIRAIESGASRSLNEVESKEFVAALKSMPWSCRK